MPGSMRAEIIEKIEAVNSSGRSAEERAAIEEAIKVPGVEKRAHFFTTLGSEPDFEVTTMESLEDYFEPILVNGVLDASSYSLVRRVFIDLLE